MVIKPLAITYIKTSPDLKGMRATVSPFLDAMGAGRICAGMSTVFQFAAASVFWAGRSSPELLPRQRFDSAAQLARTASSQAKMLTERGDAPPFIAMEVQLR